MHQVEKHNRQNQVSRALATCVRAWPCLSVCLNTSCKDPVGVLILGMGAKCEIWAGGKGSFPLLTH